MCGLNHWVPIAGTRHEIKDASSPQTAGAEERSEPLKCLGSFVHGHLTGMESQNDLLELPIRICEMSSERAIRAASQNLSIENRHRTNGVPHLGAGRPWRGASTNHEQAASDPKISPTKQTTRLVASTRRGTTSRGLDGGLLAAAGRPSHPRGEPHMVLSRGRHVGLGGEMVKRAVGCRPLAGERDCLLSIAKKGTFTRHSVCHKGILSICSLCCPKVFK